MTRALQLAAFPRREERVNDAMQFTWQLLHDDKRMTMDVFIFRVEYKRKRNGVFVAFFSLPGVIRAYSVAHRPSHIGGDTVNRAAHRVILAGHASNKRDYSAATNRAI